MLEYFQRIDTLYKRARQDVVEDFAVTPNAKFIFDTVTLWHDAVLLAWSSLLEPVAVQGLDLDKVSAWLEERASDLTRLAAFCSLSSARAWVGPDPKKLLVDKFLCLCNVLVLGHHFLKQGDDGVPAVEEQWLKGAWSFDSREMYSQSLQALLNGALATFPQQALLQQNSVDLKVNAEQLTASSFIVTVQGQVKASLVERVKSNFTPFSDAWRAAAGLMVLTQPEPFRNVPEDVLKNIDDKANAASSFYRS